MHGGSGGWRNPGVAAEKWLATVPVNTIGLSSVSVAKYSMAYHGSL